MSINFDYDEIPLRLGIELGDNIFISSDITSLAFYCLQKTGIKFNPENFISAFTNAVGENGTIVFPTYNWGFCNGKTFDYKKTISKVGALTNVALKMSGFKRTRHPIYSFAVWGKDRKVLTNLENRCAFGADSPFAYFYLNHYKNIGIDVDLQNSTTFVHYCEQKQNVDYRYIKKFSSTYIDENNISELRTYSMYVRRLDINVTVAMNSMLEIYKSNKAIQNLKINDISYFVLDMYKAYNLVEEDIITNESKNIAIIERGLL